MPAARPLAAPTQPYCRLYLDPHDKFTRVAAEPGAASRFPHQTVSNITVNYTGFTVQAQTAFQAAVDIWQTQVGSTVPIAIAATFADLGNTSLLGQAGTGATSGFANQPRANTFFPRAIANKIAGSDLNGTSSDITAQFNSTFNWYYGTDGLTPSGQVDFVSVVLHELGHGLGFLGSASLSSGLGRITSTPYIYDVSVVDGAGISILDTATYPNNSAAMATLLTGNALFWNGANGKAANAGTRPKLYAPAVYAAGSTYSHVDESTYPPGNINSLMSPMFGFAEAIHVPGPIVTGIFNDSGWGSVCSLGLDHQMQTVGAGSSASLKLAVSAAPTCIWAATTPNSFVHLTSGAGATGAGVVRFTLDANPGMSQRQGTIVITAGNFTETQAITLTQSGSCTYALDATSASVGFAAQSIAVRVSAAAGCAWSAAVAAGSFASLTSGTSGAGNGTVVLGVPAYSGTTARMATATIAGQPFTITQGVTCAYTLSTSSANVVAAGGSFDVTVTAGTGCAWTASSASTFVGVAPASGSGTGVVTVTTAANPGIAARAATLTIAGLAYTLTQAGQPAPMMSVDRAALNFGAATTGAAFASRTPSQVVRLTQTGPAGVVTWAAASSQPWLTVTPASGVGSAALSIGVQFAGGIPAVGSTTGAVIITYTGAATATSSVNATLNLAIQTGVPFGAFDTPVSGPTALQGSVAVTGWALDDVGVSRVEIWRDVQPGEPKSLFTGTPADPRNGKVYIADALFVEGARPDVEARYGSLPVNYRAGWGYLMLTQGLFNDGNGTYVLSAFAFDQESKVSTLGQKTIVVSNQTATRPFGSIDTPGIGAVSSGTAVNFGWALTPPVGGVATCRIGANGVQVSIDSGPLQPVTFGALRQDVAARFPGLSNTSDAGGSFVFDTTALTNGTHTIVWLVTDDCNRADGIGSRFFTVSNASLSTGSDAAISTVQSVRQHAGSSDPIAVARGYGELPALVWPDASGERTVRVAQGERIEVRLPSGVERAYQLVNGERRPLPAGATWDAASQAFYWQPAAPFLGEFQFVFVGGGDALRVLVVLEASRRSGS